MLNINNNTCIVKITDNENTVVVGVGYIPVLETANATTLNGEEGNFYLNRDNHTGTQNIDTVNGLSEQLEVIDESIVSLGDDISNLQSEVVALDQNKADRSEINDRYKGTFTSYGQLVAAYPTANAGDQAQVNIVGFDTIVFAWDDDDSLWVAIGASGAANTDQLPEGTTNLYHTPQRVRDTTVGNITKVNSEILLTDNVNVAFGKAQGQLDNKTPLSHVGSGGNSHAIATTSTAGFMSASDKTKIDGLSTVATSGSYNDLRDKPTIPSGDSPLYTTPTVLKNFTNQLISTPPLASECLFDQNFVIPANTLVAGDVYLLHAYLIARTVSQSTASFILVPHINDSNINGSNATVALLLNGNTVYEIKCFIIVGATGVSGIISVQGLVSKQDNNLVAFSNQTATYNTTQTLTLNFPIRLNAALNANSWLRLRSAKLYKLT